MGLQPTVMISFPLNVDDCSGTPWAQQAYNITSDIGFDCESDVCSPALRQLTNDTNSMHFVCEESVRISLTDILMIIVDICIQSCPL